MYAGRLEGHVDGREFMDFGDERYVRLHSREPVPVELAEDPEGTYWGWIDAPDWHSGYCQTPGVPTMIQPHQGMFTMQFAYGPAVEVERGRGEIVRMSCRALSPEEPANG